MSQEPLVIDTHAHLYPAIYLDFLEEIGVSSHSTRIARNLRASDEVEEMNARIQQMDAAGVDMQVLSVVPQLPLIKNAQKALHAVQMVNDIYAHTVATHPNRFKAYGALPLPHQEASIAELDRVLDELGFLGVAFPAILADGMSLADPVMDPIWDHLNRRGARVYIHATGAGANCNLINEHQLEWVNGAPVEDAIAVLHLLKADIPYRFPNIRFHVAHLGGDLPFLSQRIEDNFQDWGSFEHSPHEALRTMHFDAANFHGPSLRLAVETLGQQNIMVGSDYPYFQDEKYSRAVQYIKDAGLSTEAERKVLIDNAVAFYDL